MSDVIPETQESSPLSSHSRRNRRLYILGFLFIFLFGSYVLFSGQIRKEIEDRKFCRHLFEYFLTDPTKKITTADYDLLFKLESRNKKRMVELFANSIENPDMHIRRLMIRLLAHIGKAHPDCAIPALSSASEKDPDGDIRSYALVALEEMDASPERMLPALVRGLQDSHQLVCIESIRIIQVFRIKEAKPFLIPLLSHTDANIRGNTVGIMSEVEAKESIPKLMQIFESDTDQDVRFNAVMALGALQSREALPIYIKALYEPDPRFLVFTLEIFEKLAFAEAVPHLKKILAKTSDDTIRLHICGALIRAGGEAETVLPILIEIFNKYRSLKYSLHFPLNLFISLGKEAEGVHELLTEAFFDPTFPYKNLASVALYRIDPNETHLQYILNILADQDKRVSFMCYSILSVLREHNVDFAPFREAVFSLRKSPNRGLRSCALEFLPLLDTPEKIWPLLCASLNDEEKTVRREAIKQCIQLQPKQVGTILQEMLAQKNIDLQLDMIWGFGQLGKESAYREYAVAALAKLKELPEKRLQKLAQFHWEKCFHQSWSYRPGEIEYEEEESEKE